MNINIIVTKGGSTNDVRKLDSAVPSIKTFYDFLIRYLHENDIECKFQTSGLNVGNESFQQKLHQNNTIYWHSCHTGYNIWNVKIAYTPGYFYFDKSGFSGWSEVAQSDYTIPEIDTKRACEYYDNVLSRIIKGNISKFNQPKNTRFNQSDFYFLPLQDANDVVMKLCYFDGLVNTVKYIGENLTNEKIIVKLHPKAPRSNSIIQDICSKYSQFEIINNISIHDIIPRCKGVLTINSGVGFESLLHLKPVFCFGKSDYGRVCHNIKSTSQIKDIPNMLNLDTNSIKKFLYFFMREYLVCSLTYNEFKQGIESKLKNVIAR